MNKIILSILIIGLFSCENQDKNKFSLLGNTHEIEDESVLYVLIGDKIIDSTLVQNNTFRLDTELPEAPIQVILATKDVSQYRFLWLENRPMVFDATSTDFSRAQVLGSKEENLSQALDKKTEFVDSEERAPIQQDFIKEHPNSLHSAYLLSVYSTSWGKEITQELFENFPEDIQNSSYGKEIQDFIRLEKDHKVNNNDGYKSN